MIKYAGQEVTLQSFQTCASAVMGMRFSVQQSTLWHYVTLSKNTGIHEVGWKTHSKPACDEKPAKSIVLVSGFTISNAISLL